MTANIPTVKSNFISCSIAQPINTRLIGVAHYMYSILYETAGGQILGVEYSQNAEQKTHDTAELRAVYWNGIDVSELLDNLMEPDGVYINQHIRNWIKQVDSTIKHVE